MDSRNPVLHSAIDKAEKEYAGSGALAAEGSAAYQQAATAGTAAAAGTSAADLESMYARAARGEATMQLPDVVAKTGLMFVVLLVGAAIGWTTWESSPFILFGSMLIALGLGIANVVKRKVSPLLVMLYAFFEGVFLGGISAWYQYSPSINPDGAPLVQQAVLGTLVAFGVMLFLYQSRIIKVNGTFAKVMMVAIISYALIGLASLIAALFGVGGGWGFYGVGGLGIILCVIGVGLAAFTLALDFEAISQGINAGMPERESWRMAFGLMVTLVWLYLEILRFLAILQRS
jgi:uncharacterized YccA/Bax inhibitor family protein